MGFSNLFVKILNQFLPGVIVFTCDFGETSINFLDLIIFKGARFAESGCFDFKVFQKSTNLYQYIPFSSEHPLSTKVAFMLGELTRYTTHSSTYEFFREIRFSFYLRLRARGYPSKLLHSTFSRVLYSNRASKIYPPSKSASEQPLFLNLPFDRWTDKLDWNDDMYCLDMHFHPSPPPNSCTARVGRSLILSEPCGSASGQSFYALNPGGSNNHTKRYSSTICIIISHSNNL